MDISTRSLNSIKADVIVARKEKARLEWKPEELAADMLIVVSELEQDIKKYLAKGMDAPAKRIRSNTKLLETLGKSFRVESVKK